MSSVIAIGGGGHCRACIDVIDAQKAFSLAGIVLQRGDPRKEILGFPVLGFDDNLPDLINRVSNVLIAVGQIETASVRIKLYENLLSLNASFPIIKSDLAYCSRYSEVGAGSILMHGCIINSGAQIGRNCIVNSQALIEHDAKIADHCHISTGAKINGDVSIGEGAFIGSGCVVKEGVSIGSGAVIGAGLRVMKDIPDRAIIKANHV